MKRKMLLCCAVVIVAALAVLLTSCQGSNSAGSLITVLNPIAEKKMVDRIPLSPRLDKIDGKTIYLVDINWGGPDAAYSVFEEIRDWFAKNNPSVNIVIRRKAGSYSADDPTLWKEIAEKGHAALVGISG